MYDRRGHRILNGTSTTPSRKGSESPLNARASPSRPRTSPFLKPIRRAHGATPPPAEMDEVCAMRWRKYNAILESICRDSPDDESPPPRPPAFDYRGVELIAALAPGFGKFLFLAKAKSFAWWKNSTAKMQPKAFYSESPRNPSPTKPIASNGAAQPTPNRRLKISAKFSDRWKVSTGSQQLEDCGSLSTSKQYDLRQLKKDQQTQQLSPEKNELGFDSPGSTHATGVGAWSDVDLNSLGLMPDIIYPLFHANEAMLWKMFRDYVLCEDSVGLPAAHRSLALSTSREQKTERMETRLMPFDIMWTIVRDFDISPDFCNKSVLQQSVKYVQYIMGSSRSTLLKSSDRSHGGSLGSTWAAENGNGWTNSLASTGNGGGFSSTGGSRSELGSPKKVSDESYLDPEFERLSFSEFLKVLWQLSIRCTDRPPNSHPILHAQILFRIMDSSDGRNRMAKRHRTSSIIPRFIGCSLKENTTAASRSAPQQNGIMQYLRKVMSQGPPPTALKVRDATPVNSPNEDALEYALNRIIADDSFTPQSKPAKSLKIDFEGTDHESPHSSIKSSNRARESLFSARKHPKSCPACSESVPPTPDPLVFG